MIELPKIELDANKYTRGSLLILAGSTRFTGAAILAAQAASRCGAGYVTLAIPAGAAQVAQSHLLSIPVISAGEKDGSFAADALVKVVDSIRPPDAILCGPGLTVTESTCSFLADLLRQVKQPLVLDADALNLLAMAEADFGGSNTAPPDAVAPGPAQRQLWQLLPAQSVLTPHQGELDRLLAATGCEDAQQLAQQLQAVVVAKSHKTLVYSPDKATQAFEFTAGTPALAKAGTGDVLAGIIASLLAQGMDAWSAATAGVEIHGRAAFIAETRTSRRSMMAEDVIDAIAHALRELEGF